jgi:4-diphosphocytidyl-2-C-methyl-D-erythritol kinase
LSVDLHPANAFAGAGPGMAPGLAPAKVNLTLHVTGQRPDGYHLLDSLVVFADVGDQISATAAEGLTLSVTGPFAKGVPLDDSNLILRAAKALRAARGVTRGAALRLNKVLPHAAGIGSGSADAAAALRLLAALWEVPPLAPDDPLVLGLGADVPVCLHAPRPARMAGIGGQLSAVPPLPHAALVLVNPRVAVPTPAVFKTLSRRENPPMAPMPTALDFDGFAYWLNQQRNDLLPGAEAIAPEITTALTKLRQLPGVAAAVMSGSGATCVGLVRDMGAARAAARAMQVAQMSWWVVPAALLG